MSKRYDSTDQIIHYKDHDNTPFYVNGNRRQSDRFDTYNCRQCGFLVDVYRLGRGKRLSFLYEDSDILNGAYTDVMEGQSNWERDDFVTEPGVYNVAYWGERRFIRLEIITRTTNPQGAFRLYAWRTGFLYDPRNLSPRRLNAIR